MEALKARLADSQEMEKAKVAAEIASTLRQSDAEQALQYARMALQQLEVKPHEPTKVNVINTLAVAHLQKREYDATSNYAEQALRLSRTHDLPLEEARALNTLGALQWYQGDLDKAKKLFESSLTLRKQHHAVEELSPALNNLGVIEEIQGRYNKAIEFYIEAIDHAEQIGSDEQLARPIGNLGVLHQMLKNFDKALFYYQRSLELKLKTNNLVGAALAHNNISEIQVESGEYQAALDSLRAGLDLLEKIDAPQEKALLLVNSGSANLHMNNPDKALEFFSRSGKVISGLNTNEIKLYLAQGYARAYLQKNLPDQALAHAREFLMLAQAKQDHNSIKKAHYLHYQIYKHIGLYAEALAEHENFNRIQEELSNKETTDYVARLQAEFDTERKEKELAILKRQTALQEVDIRRQQFLRNLIAVLSLSALVVGFFIYRLRATRIETALLEQKVAERTREIQHQNRTIAELLQQKEELLERKNILFSTVSHEFRTPLTLIMGPLKQLSADTRSNETRLTLDNVHRNATRLLRMVDQLLDLARMDMQVEQRSEPVEVGAVLNLLITSMETLFDEHHLVTELRLEEDIWIEISPEALEKVFVNLLSNAVKYTDKGGRIRIAAQIRDKTAVISVSDTGIGIASEQHACIFERFTRLENQFSKPIPGAGIGLALVKELVERYSGRIDLDSEIGHGSTFTVVFPLAEPARLTGAVVTCTRDNLRSTACDSELAAMQPVAATTLPREEHLPVHAKTVLIVEDNPQMREFIGNHLNRHYRCLFAEDGKQGIRLAVSEIPDLIISDLMMPGVNGLELASTLREDQLTSHIPIIILTAKGDPESRHAAWRKNVDEYIEKPFDADELLLRCENILSIRQLVTDRFRLKAPIDENVDDAGKRVEHTCFHQRDREFMDKLHRYLENNFYENPLNAGMISNALAITEKQLQRKLKALTNETIPAYVRNFRLKKGAEMLSEGANVTTVALDVGFSSQSYFSTAFAARYGCSPSDYQHLRRKHQIQHAKESVAAG